MRNYKKLNISGTLLDKFQLDKHIEKTASEHSIKMKSSKDTYPIPNLISNYKFILETYNLLTKNLKTGIKIHSAGEWILDNFYVIEETVKVIQKELPMKKYINMIGIANDKYFGFARSYVLAEEIVAFSDCKIDREIIDIALNSYQKKKLLSIDEINNIGIFIKISIISHIKELCEKIYSSQIQKMKAENILERILENKSIVRFAETKKFKLVDEKNKYAFIEYMSYKLKRYGKKAIAYQDILEKEVQKLGLTIPEVIQKEHFQIANIKITLGNCITSIKEINRINFSEIFTYMNASEEILKLDPAGVYANMDEESKAFYRRIIEKKARKTKISEVYIAEQIIKLCKRFENSENLKEKKKSHVGYYLYKEGVKELDEALELPRKIRLNSKSKSRLYIALNLIIPIYFSFLMYVTLFRISSKIWISLMFAILFYIPISEIYLRIQNYLMGKLKAPSVIPKMNYEEIPEDKATFVVIPTILKSKEKVKEMFEKLEVYYLANKSENLYFALLGDCSEENTKQMEFDEEVISAGKECVYKLNQKYQYDKFPKFHFLYRERLWNSSEKAFIGWERKRGLLTTFNKYIKNEQKNNFLENTIEEVKEKLPNIKYIITLDSDTNLNLNTASKLIGAMSHILNIPIIENEKVIDGYGIMQPRIGMDLSLSNKTYFIELFSMKGGIDCYTNAISDIYQDYFDEGIFTGKGIYDVEIYNKILKNEFPENTVLSHDLLEGNFLRCGLLTDTMLLDGYPARYIPYILRNHRWTRGDWQIIRWINSSRLNEISKFKIYDNLRRSLLLIFSFIIIILSGLNLYNNWKISFGILIVSILSIIVPYFIDIINYIIFKESNITGAVYAYKKFSRELNSIKISFIRMFLQIAFLPYEAFKNLDSIIRSIYRMKTKTKCLEWVTAEDGEKNSKTNLIFYIDEMRINLIVGTILLFFMNIVFKILGIIWIFSPTIAWYISLDKINKKVISEEDSRYLIDIAKKTWNFFEDHINEKNNYLMIDNYQEDRTNKIVNRTSSTNIGLELLAVISAYDLGFITFRKCIDYLNKIIGTIVGLSKWNGHLYNWYSTKDLTPLIPRYISTVDSGNFVGYLYIVKNFLYENRNKQSLENLIELVSELIENTDFSKLYSQKNKLFSIGYNLEENKLSDSYYDFLASEARQASLIAIAKRDVPAKHWNNLSRTLTSLNGYKGLVSWTGTAFEYLMPNINFKRYTGSLLDEASKFAIMSQIEYAKKLGVPWGISESAFNLRDLNNNYQYKAFGIPWLGLKRGLEEDIVISPYSTFLSLEDELEKGIENLKQLEKIGATGKYGFYESIDYTPSRIKNNKREIVKTYMAHHQGLIFLSLNNLLNDNILKKRFNSNPEIEATNILLQERMPIQMIITKEKKEKIVKNKNATFSAYSERIIENPNRKNRNLNVISNEKYKIIIDDIGNSYSEFENVMVNNFKETSELKQGIEFCIKNARTKKIMEMRGENKVIFSPDKAKFSKKDGNLKIEEIICLDPNRPLEIRRLEIENMGNSEEVLEVISYFEPSLSQKMEEYSHPAFNKLFMKFEENDNNIIFEKKDRQKESRRYLATTLYTENEQIVDFEYEIDKEKFFERENIGTSEMVKSQKSFSKQIVQVVQPIIAMKRTIKIRAKEVANVNLIISVSNNKQEAIYNLDNVKSEEEIIRILNIARARSEEEGKYLQVNTEKINTYCRLLKYILLPNSINMKKELENAQIDSLWKYGISGDIPILLVKIKNAQDIVMLEEILGAYEYYRAKKVFIDLVIIDEEIDVYEKFVEQCINEIISNKQLEYLKNVNSGIFILEKPNILKEDLEVIEFKASLCIDASISGLDNFLKDIEEKNKEEKEVKKEKQTNLNLEIYPLKEEKLLYDNSFGGFLENGKEYYIYKNRDNIPPAVWCNILANKFFGTIITDNLGGYTWSKNSRLNRLTAWNNDSSLDLPSEIIYFKDEDNKSIWTLNTGVIANNNYYYIIHGFGYTKIKNTNDNFSQEMEIFVPNEDSLKVCKFRIKNLINEQRNLKIVMYIKTVLGEDESLTNKNLSVKKVKNTIQIKNMFTENCFKNRIMFIIPSIKINSFTGNKDNFIGNGDIQSPDALYINLDNTSGIGKNSCVGIEFLLKLNKFENKNFSILIGETNKQEEIEKMTEKYSNEESINGEYESTKQKWKDLLNTIIVKTPDESLNLIMNGWLVYQTISSRILGKTGYYQSGGAFGFRDQLQDTIGIRYIDSNYLKEQIINSARHQFIEGDVLHWWHGETKKGIRTRFSDDLLWLVYATIEYVIFENDYSILDEQVEYLSGEVLKAEENEKYNLYYIGNIKESIFEHCIRAIECTINRGIDPFPKIGTGDWNDGFSNVGAKGSGQSIWLGFFLYDILNRFIPICKYKEREELVKKYTEVKEKLKKNLNSKGWDGRWFKRAITDDGKDIGSINSDECRIDSISQSWSVISDAADNDKKFIAIGEAENYLVDKENKIIKLFDPPFEKSEIEPGYIKSYPPGIRENGGQYTHSACWFIIAESILGFGDKATEYAKILNPIEHSKNREEAKRFKLEPYILEADLYSNKDLLGRGGWNWYTGSSSWYYRAILEYILGLKIENGYLKMLPCISKEWKEYEIQYKYKTSIYKIKVKNLNKKNTGVEKFLIDGKEIKEKQILLQDNCKIYNIEIFM